MIYDCVVVGAGAGGIFAALNINSNKVVLIDKNRGASKLSITGNGRCNITNSTPLNDFLNFYGKNGQFLRDSFGAFFRDELIEFLKSINVNTKSHDNKILIGNITSKELAYRMLNLINKSSVEFKQFETVKYISKDRYFKITTNKTDYYSKSIILACGGMSYPNTGSSGGCYRFAKHFGHKITELSPYESAFCIKHSQFKRFQGLSFHNVGINLKYGKKLKKTTGDIIFTHFGVSGPAILNLSEADFDKAQMIIRFINYDESQFLNFIRSRKGKVANVLCEKLHRRFVKEIIKTDKFCSEISNKELKEIFSLLHNFSVDVKKCPIEQAFVTKGGISLKDVDSKTMQSKIVKGLFFAGEILDIQGSIGGFNLQAAFSEGYSAAQSINNIISSL